MKKVAVAIVSFIVVAMLPNSFAQISDAIQVTAPLVENKDVIKVSIINEASLGQDKISIIQKVIKSEDRIIINGHSYFVGWTGALESLNVKAKKFDISYDSKKELGKDIYIVLSTKGIAEYNGETAPYYDGNHITTASIMIYDSKHISPPDFENLIRHEIGHALGLGHATNEQSIMYPTMGPIPKLISSCEIEGLKSLTKGLAFTDVGCSSV